MAPANRGLAPFGREMVAELNHQRAMVDLSHGGEQLNLEPRLELCENQFLISPQGSR